MSGVDPFDDLGYVELMHVREHEFVKPAGSTAKYPRCAGCGRGRWTLPHLGQPRSMNVLGSGSPEAFYSAKEMWLKRYLELLRKSPLPKPLGSVRVEGLVCFPDRRDRDQGNFRLMIEKALGDALQTRDSDGIPWLPNDDWSRYEFGNLRRHYEKGVSYTLLRLYPSDEALPEIAFDFRPPTIQQTELAVG